MNCVSNEDVDNLVWSRYRGNSVEFLVKKIKYVFFCRDIYGVDLSFINLNKQAH
jgi:hypothetical protein